MKKQMLDGSWQLSFTMPESTDRYQTEVEVPCNVEPYLVKLGLVEDYMPCDTCFATQKFDAVDDWTYVRYFDAEAATHGNRRELVFDGIDTIAEVYLNGEKILDCDNIHLQYRCDVTDKLAEKNNELKVIIRSNMLWAREHLHDNFSVAMGGKSTGYDSFMNIRKPRYIWGWDNTPRLMTSGIVRSVYIEEIPQKYFDSLYVYTRSITDTNVGIGFDWSYVTPRKDICDHQIRVSILDGEESVYSAQYKALFVQGTHRCSIPRDKIQLWWPLGMGEHKLYTAKIEMLEGDDVVACHEQRFGIRTIHLDWTEDVTAEGGRFHFIVNGQEIFVRGTNWKPLSPLVSEADKKTREGKALAELVNLSCNMVRIWGGGVYEDEYFYDFCDENGIMIWQDFMLACEIPSLEEAFLAQIANEAKYVIKKYRNHPSLAVWCGDNENDGFMLWLNRDKTMSRPSLIRVTRETIKNAVVSWDPYRDYVPSSPYFSDAHFLENRSGKPIVHETPEKHYYTNPAIAHESLRRIKSIFFGETGPMASNAVSPNPKFFEREKARAKEMWDMPQDDLLTLPYHQEPFYFKGWRQSCKDALMRYFGRDFTFEEFWDYAIGVNFLCAEMFKDIIEYCRVMRPSKSGVLWWSLIDMFPMMFNYSVIDSEFNHKLPYYWIKQSQQEFALVGECEKHNGPYKIYAINDTMTDVVADYTITAYDEDLNKTVIATGVCEQKKNSAEAFLKPVQSNGTQLWIIKWTYKGKTCVNHAITGKVGFDTMKKWVKVISEETGNDFLELARLEE